MLSVRRGRETSMHAILVSMGTDGDVIPYVGLGRELRALGHRVTLAANEHFEAMALDLGLGFRPLVSNLEMNAVLADPDFWHPLKSPRAGARLVGLVPRQYALVAELAREDDAILVANPGVFAARLVQEKLSRPMATLLLQPGMVSSRLAPPIMPCGLTLPSWAPGLLGNLYWRLVDGAGHALVGRHLNRLRLTLGLKPVNRLFPWWVSPELVIGMFPPWYGPPQSDWPPQMKLAGFPMFDGGGITPADVLDFCDAGKPPVVFTLGTGMMHAASFFRSALAACQTIGARGLFMTKYPRQLPAALPASIRHCAFAPFSQLLPHCAAVVHHGGAGTVAKALATGTPQLILPLAWDQPDNAARVKQLGVGEWLKNSQRTGKHIAQALIRLSAPRIRARCRKVASFLGGADSLKVAAVYVDDLYQRRHRREVPALAPATASARFSGR
jgi:rhamnosyltransferase subunit B